MLAAGNANRWRPSGTLSEADFSARQLQPVVAPQFRHL